MKIARRGKKHDEKSARRKRIGNILVAVVQVHHNSNNIPSTVYGAWFKKISSSSSRLLLTCS